VGRGDEALARGGVQHGGERCEVARHVEDAARLGMDAELGPGDDLEELVEGAVAAGKHDEGVRGVGHRGLPLVHRVDDGQAGQRRVGEFPVG
jgi:hypothetical protein